MLTSYKAEVIITKKNNSETLWFRIKSNNKNDLKIRVGQISKLFPKGKYDIECISTNVMDF